MLHKLAPDFKDFVARSAEEHARRRNGTAKEATELEAAMLLALPRDKKVIVDTSTAPLLREISDYSRSAVMRSPQSMGVERFLTEATAKSSIPKRD